MATEIPDEFNITETSEFSEGGSGIGYTMKGWNFSVEELAEAQANNILLNPAYELASNACPWNCFFCFTEDPNNPDSLKKRLEGELTLEERLNLIDESKRLGARSINIIGAGEPTIDPHFWKIIEHISSRGITPIVYTEGALKLTKREFAKRLYDLDVTVVLKVNSLENEAYQNATVNSGKRRSQPLKLNYFRERNEALGVLMDTGFNKSDPTRLAFDIIICKENYAEIPAMHRYARDNNIFVLFVGYLPSGRSSTDIQNAVSADDISKMYSELARIDKEEYGLCHRSNFPYAGGVPCTIRKYGLYVKIRGEAWDCPGETKPLGNIRQNPLTDIWSSATKLREQIDYQCGPRDETTKLVQIRQHKKDSIKKIK